ncbi:MAG: 4Fe-4S binding protein [Proteobacteria bacterium]|nr:4Fe-4S binding protein [Pseudomonadota bacterium]MBU1640649.1 4Fe-4S binding protein [Pseudomonadota bacterium]
MIFTPNGKANFFRQHLPRLRLAVQLAFLSFTLWVGWQFYLFYQWTRDLAPYTPRPPAVEGFLPIGALVALKRFVLTGDFDQAHPAGLTIFLAALCLGLLARKGFCGWICPVGTVSNLAERSSKKLKTLLTLPGWLNLPLMGLKYLILALFAYLIIWSMPLTAIKDFMASPYSLTADGRMLLFFLEPSGLALTITFAIIALSILIRNFWCRFLCPYGALLGLLAYAGPFAITRNADLCSQCHQCSTTCPAEIKVHSKDTLRSPECLGCLECTAVCPEQDCLQLKACNKNVPLWLLPLVIVGLYGSFYLWARLSGHWQTNLSAETLKIIYQKFLHTP